MKQAVKGEAQELEVPPLEEITAGIVEAYKRRGLPDDPGASTGELAVAWGICGSTARGRIREMLGEGLLIKGSRGARNVEGRPYRIAVYRLKET